MAPVGGLIGATTLAALVLAEHRSWWNWWNTLAEGTTPRHVHLTVHATVHATVHNLSVHRQAGRLCWHTLQELHSDAAPPIVKPSLEVS